MFGRCARRFREAVRQGSLVIGGAGGAEDLGELGDDIVELLDVVGLGKVSFRAVSQAFGDVLMVPGGAPDDLSDGIVAAIPLEGLQDIGPGLDGHFIIEDEDGRQVGGWTVFEVPGDFNPVFEEFKRDAGMAFEDVMSQHFLVVDIVIREGNIGRVSHWLLGVSFVRSLCGTNVGQSGI